MLVLSRIADESIPISDDIAGAVLLVCGKSVRAGIAAEEDVPVHRSELRVFQAQHEQSSASSLRLLESTTTLTSATPANAVLSRCPRPPTCGAEFA